MQEQDDPNKMVHETTHSKTVLVYKKDFVPYSTRIYNFITSFSSEPGSGEGGEQLLQNKGNMTDEKTFDGKCEDNIVICKGNST